MENEHYAFILIADEKYWKKLRDRNKTNEGVHAFVRKNQVAPIKPKAFCSTLKNQ